MSQVTDPVLLDSTGQDIVTGISAVVSAIRSRGMPSPSASNPQMDGTASPGTSNDYARGDHVHPENPANAKTAQLAYVETGTTASQNYTVGQYISLNGLLYTADTAIASGATFYTSGGNKNLTECVGGGFNSLKAKLVTNHTITYSSADTAFIADTPPIDSKDLVVVGRNTNTGAIYAMWYRAASHGFRISATLYGNAPANGDTCVVQYAS